MKHLRERRAIVAAVRRMNELGLNQGASGNASLRISDGLLVTPSAVPAEAVTPADIVEMDLSGDWRAARTGRRPSSEWRLHREILRARPEFGAVVHAHPIHATALACQRRAIPAFHYMVAVAGGSSIRCARYATFGTAALARNVLAALAGRRACLLANHGLVACDADLDRAVALALEVETLAAQYCQVLQLGKPKILSEAEMRRVLAKMRAGPGYGSLAAPPKTTRA